jgi:NAD(P)-dependent dehydrogenase (short-subunit alcohol dehydrogenase family)
MMNIRYASAMITGAASGIGQAVAIDLAERGIAALGLVDQNEHVLKTARMLNDLRGEMIAEAFVGDVTNDSFRGDCFDAMQSRFGIVRICVPAAGIARDTISVQVNTETETATLYPIDLFRQVAEVNLIAPMYWALEMIGRIALDRRQRGLGRWDGSVEEIQGSVVFIGSVASEAAPGQIAFAAAKAGLDGVAATLSKEALEYGVNASVIHPGYTNTPMVRALGEDYIRTRILPNTRLNRLLQPSEIADAIYFLLTNVAVGGELWTGARIPKSI